MEFWTLILSWLAPCANNACVKVDVYEEGVKLTSTLGADKGAVVYTHDEWAEFVTNVKAGRVDETIRQAVSV